MYSSFIDGVSVKENKRINILAIVIILMAFIVVVELVIILRSILDIKSENGNLKYEMSKVMDANKKLNEKNKNLEKAVKELCEPKITPPDVPDGWKVYRHLSMGFEIGCPQGCKAEVRDREDIQKAVMTILIDNSDTSVEIYAADINTYRNINDYISKKYDYKLYVKETIIINNRNYDIYKLSGEKQYHVLFKGRQYIFDISSYSQEFLVKIVGTFKFI
jgi:hypothetical protein